MNSTRPIRRFAVLIILAICLCAVAPAADEKDNPAFAPVVENPALPRVLLIGDSISIGYTLGVRARLAGRANVLRIPENGGPTTRGIQSIDAWLGSGKWDVIHFNWGLHDIKHMKDGKTDPAGGWQVSPDAYRANLEKLVTRLKATGARLIWAATTPVPEGTGTRVPGDEIKVNAIAAEIMRKHGIPVDDLHASVLPKLATLQLPRNVHFTRDGYDFLAGCVAESIAQALPDPAKPAASPGESAPKPDPKPVPPPVPAK